MKAVPSKSQNVAKSVQQESKKVKATPGKQQNNEKDVSKKSQENNVNGAKKKRNDNDNFSDEEDSDEDVITCKGCNKQFKTYLDYVHKDHMKVTTPCWTEYCKQDD